MRRQSLSEQKGHWKAWVATSTSGLRHTGPKGPSRSKALGVGGPQGELHTGSPYLGPGYLVEPGVHKRVVEHDKDCGAHSMVVDSQGEG